MGSSSDFDKLRSQLSPAKQSLLDKRLRGEGKSSASRSGIPKRPNPQGPAPLSYSQRRLWFLDRLDPGRATYNVPAAWQIHGRLDMEALRRALSELLRRHEILRTRYYLQTSEPRQQAVESVEAKLILTDFSSFPSGERERAVESGVQAAACQSFDLGVGEVFRVHLWRLGEEEFVLLLNQHHISSDAWSSGILFRELSALYEGFTSGQAAALVEPEIQYSDYAAWQRDTLRGPALETPLKYWKQRLSNTPSLLDLPLDHPRPVRQSYRGAMVEFHISQATSDPIRALAQEQGVTPFMLLLTAFKVLLFRYSRQEDLVIGTPIAGRNRTDLESLVGFFVNTLVLRTDVGGDPTFLELLQRVKETCLGAFAHQELPFEYLVEELCPTRDQSMSPLFQVMFMLQNAPEGVFHLPGLRLTPMEVRTGTAKFDLTLGMAEGTEGYQGWFEYNSDLFEPGTIERMAGHWEQLLWGIAANPQQRMSELPLLPAEERRRIVVEWNDTRRPYPARDVLPGLFEAQVVRSPHADAVIAGKQRVSYRELNHRAERLAQHLRRLGVGPEVLVAICAERSLELIVSVLGVLKAGGAYVPLDPHYPQERLAFVMEDTRALVLLTQRSLTSRLPPHQARNVFVDEPLPEMEEISAFSAVAPRPENLAYVIYTSGSTGRPKGVAIEHRSVCSFVHWAKEQFSPRELAGVLFSTSICFDLSIFELFATLSSGGKVILASHLLELPKLTASHEVTLINTVPSAMSELLRLAGLPVTVRVVNLAGEPLKSSLVDQIYSLGHVEKVHDLYGPSEDTTYSAFALRRVGQPPTIGRPIANTQLYILDPHRQPVPAGIPGEIYLGGEGLARGYLHRPDLTEERFVPDPFTTQPKARLYRTGDLARFRPDGNVEFLGRMDHQVKVRGFRIELGEIESALMRFPAVKSCVVMVREDFPGDRRLFAYLECTPSDTPTGPQLREHLRTLLPDFLIPSGFIPLPELPLTPNGKIDRKRLPAPERDPSRRDAEYQAPRDPIEIQIARIWEQLLELRRVGLHDNFFELGGHSLMGVHLFVEIEKTLGKNLPLATLFHAPTVEELARIVREGGGKVTWSSLVPIQPKGRRTPFFCIHAAGGNVLFYRDLALRLGEDQPFYGLQPKGLDGSSERHRTIEEMARHYIAEIQSVQPQGPYYIGGSSYGGLVAWEMACQLESMGQQVGLLALFDTHGPGYPEYLPGVSRFQFRVHTFRQLVSHHWSSLWLLPPSKRAAHLISKLKKVRLRVQRMSHRRFKRMGSAVYRLMGMKIPTRLQAAQDIILTAGLAYHPRLYHGVVTIFRASERGYGIKFNPTLGWEKVATGTLNSIEIPGYHGTMVVEPRVGLLVERLRPLLSRGERS